MNVELIVVAAIAVVGLVVGVITLVNVIALRRTLRSGESRPVDRTAPGTGTTVESGNVFCRHCGSMYDSGQAACPSCRTPRG